MYKIIRVCRIDKWLTSHSWIYSSIINELTIINVLLNLFLIENIIFNKYMLLAYFFVVMYSVYADLRRTKPFVYFTYIPNNVPPKWAAWSNICHFKSNPIMSNDIIPNKAWNQHMNVIFQFV